MRRTLLLPFLALLGCGGDVAEPYAPATGSNAASLYWALTLAEHAVTLSTASPYDTITLSATPHDRNGAALTGLGPITFRSTDPQKVLVTSDGRMQAIAFGQAIPVVAELDAGNARHSDTVYVNVNVDPAPQVPAHLAIAPAPPDSTTWPVGGDGSLFFLEPDGSVFALDTRFLSPRVTDAGGQPVAGVAVAYSISDSTVASISNTGDGSTLWLLGSKPGRVTVIATATAYGVTLADTSIFTFTMPAFGVVKIVPRATGLSGSTTLLFAPSEITVEPGGTVIWVNLGGHPVDIVFDDSTNVTVHGIVSCAAAGVEDLGGDGNIAPFGEPPDPQGFSLSAENCRSRRFTTSGVYPYHSTATGAVGRVIVSDGLSAP